jgi:hypothetical protein
MTTGLCLPFHADFAEAFCGPSFFALYSAQRFLVASIMALRPAALSLRFFLAAGFAGPCLADFSAAHRFLCAAAMRARTSGLRFPRPRPAGAEDSVAALADFGGRPRRPVPRPSMDRTCWMCLSIVCFCASKPCSAALSTSELKPRGCVMYLIMHHVATYLKQISTGWVQVGYGATQGVNGALAVCDGSTCTVIARACSILSSSASLRSKVASTR